MSTPSHAPTPISTRARAIGLGIGGAAVSLLAIVGSWVAAGVALLALLGTPLFAIMGGSAEIAWLLHKDAEFRHLRFIAPPVLDQHFSDSPILVTIPLFTFVGYTLAEAKTADRIVHAARSVLGWLPGGLAIVCVVASAFFTLLTGGSGVTIIAIGGLLYPALRKQKYSESFSLGLVTTGGLVGLLLPYSLPLLIFALVAHVDFTVAFKAVVVPGVLVIGLLGIYSAYVGLREGVKRDPPNGWEILRSTWALKWEVGIAAILGVGIKSGLATIDECAGLVAAYTVAIEFFILKDLSIKRDLGRIAKASMSMAGAIIIILAMANALMGYVLDERIPSDVLAFLLKIGIDQKWQFLIVMNIFLLVLGMVMEGFSAILVAVPLMLPFVADLGERHPGQFMSPFQLGMIFILNLELAYCVPPLGLNLFIASFRFNKPVTSLYRVVLPFAGVLTFALVLVTAIPWFSTVGVQEDIRLARAKAMATVHGSADVTPELAKALDGKTLVFTIDGKEHTVIFSGASNAAEVVSQANAVLPGVASSETKRLSLRVPLAGAYTLDSKLVIGDGTANPLLAFTKGSKATGRAPREAWMLECVQNDPTDPKPCTQEDRQKFGVKEADPNGATPPPSSSGAPSPDCNPDFGPCDGQGTAPGDCNPDFGPCGDAAP